MAYEHDRISRRALLQGTLAVAGATTTLATAANAPSARQTLVVAHGAWSSGWAWKKMHPRITALGHLLYTPSYTGLGERAHLARREIDLDTHITDVVNVLVYEDLRDVVLIAHSYGGMVGTGVADRARDRVRRLIYLDAFVPDGGQSLFDLTGGGEPMKKAAIDGWRVPPNPTPADTAAADLPWINERRLHQPIRTFEQKLTLTNGPLTLPRDYVLCTKNDTFRTYHAKAKAAGWPVHEISATHNPHVTAPDALTELIARLVSRPS